VSLSNPPRYASNSALAERQVERFGLVRSLIQRDYPFENKDEARQFFTKLTGLLKNLKYSELNTKEYNSYRAQIDLLAETLGRPVAAHVASEAARVQAASQASAS